METASCLWSIQQWMEDGFQYRLTFYQQGIYRALVDACWMFGSIESDPAALSARFGFPVEDLGVFWPAVESKFYRRGDRLVHFDCEADRKRLKAVRQSKKEAGRLGGIASGESRRLMPKQRSSTAQAEPKQNRSKPKPVPVPRSRSLDSSNTVDNSPLLVFGATAGVVETKAVERDLAFDLFTVKFREALGTAYIHTQNDFFQLARIRQANSVPPRAVPADWPNAVDNYLASPFQKYSIAHLCSMYATIKNSPLDRYQKPVNHRGAKHYEPESAAERRTRKNNAAVNEALSGMVDEGGDRAGGSVPSRHLTDGSSHLDKGSRRE